MTPIIIHSDYHRLHAVQSLHRPINPVSARPGISVYWLQLPPWFPSTHPDQ